MGVCATWCTTAGWCMLHGEFFPLTCLIRIPIGGNAATLHGIDHLHSIADPKNRFARSLKLGHDQLIVPGPQAWGGSVCFPGAFDLDQAPRYVTTSSDDDAVKHLHHGARDS